MAALRITTGAPAAVPSPQFYESDGYTTATLEAPPTVAVVREGTTDPITVEEPTETSDGYQIVIPADEFEQPGQLTATWTAEVDSIDQVQTQSIAVVGGVYVPLADLWQLKGLADGKYPPQVLLDLEAEFEDLAERWTGHAWVPRYAVEVHPYRDGQRVILGHTRPRSILSAIDDLSVAVDTTLWQLERSGLVRYAYLGRTTTIRYLHGADAPPPTLIEACKDYVRSKALERHGGNRVGRDVLQSTDATGGSIRYSTPDWNAGRPTGYLDVDRALNALGGPVPGIA